MDREQFLKNKIKSLKSDNNFNNYQASIIAQTMYAQQGTVKNNLTDLEAKQANNITGINFNREGIDQLFMTEEESEKERQAKFFAQKNLETQRRNKITDITAETQSPFANRRIWHDQRPERYTGKEEIKEGKHYDTILYKDWEDYKKTPQYLNYKNPTNQSVAYNQFGGMNMNPNMFQYPNMQSQMMSPQQDFSLQNQNYQRNIHTPAQQPQTKNDFIWGDNNGDGITDEKDNKDKFGNSLKVKTDQEIQDEEQEYNTRYNIMNPYGGMDLESSLAYTGQQFSQGNVGMGVAGAGLSLLKGTRNFMGGYASGKESNRVKNEYLDKRFNQNPNFVRAQQGGEQDQMQQIFEMIAQMLQEQVPPQEIAQQLVEMGVPQEQVMQLIEQVAEQMSQEQPTEQDQMARQGGKIKNSEMLTGEFIADEGQGNTNLEDQEFVKRAETGDVKKVVGEPHLKNGKIAEGVNANLEEGDKVLSNYTKIPAKTVKELKERYSLSLKKDATFADAQKAFDKKIGVTKVTEDLAQSIEKMGKNEQVKDETTKRLNELTIADEITKNKEKLEMLKDPQSAIFEQLFAVQESVPKLGDGSQLFDKNGKEVTEKHSSVAQQGGYYAQEAPNRRDKSNYEKEIEKDFIKNGYSSQQQVDENIITIQDKDLNDSAQNKSETSPIRGFNSARDQWVAVTGRPWSDAKRLGYTDGTAKDNVKLLNELKDPRFKKENLRSSPINKEKNNDVKNDVKEVNDNIKKYKDFIKSKSKISVNSSNISQTKEKDFLDYLDQGAEYLGNPIQTLGHINQYGELPSQGFSKKGRTNNLDDVLGMINPARWVSATNNAIDAIGNEEYLEAGKEALNAAGALSRLKYVQYLPFDKMLPAARATQNISKVIGTGQKVLQGSNPFLLNQQGGYKQKTNIAPPKGNLSQDEIEYLAHKWRGTYSANNLPSGGLYGISDINKSEEMQELSDIQLKQVSKYMNESGVLTDIYQGLPNAFSEHRGDKNRLLQQGGIMDIASKYGISEERVMELVGMQQGGMIKRADGSYSKLGLWDNIRAKRGSGKKPTKQMLEQEAKIKRSRQEGGEQDQMQQIFEGISQMLQQGANSQEIAQQLVEMGIPQEQIEPLIMQVMEQLQGQPMEQEMAQQGMFYAQEAPNGKWVYNVTTGKNEYKNNVRAGQRAVEGKAYGIIEPEKALQFLYNNFPDIISDKFKDNITLDKQGNVSFKKNISLNKEQQVVGLAQKAMDSRMKGSADVILNNPAQFSQDVVKEAQRYKDDETFLQGDSLKKDDANSIRGYDNKVGDFTSGRYSLGLDLVTPEDKQKLMSAGINTLKQLKSSDLLSKLSPESKKRVDNMTSLVGDKDADFFINEFQLPKPAEKAIDNTDYSAEQKTQNTPEERTENVMPWLPQALRLAPSALDPIAKSQIDLQRQEPIKMSTEAMFSEQERQRQTEMARLENSGLTPQQMASMSASGLASSQMASNDAENKVATYNAQNAFTTDQFNIGQSAKEDITNEQFRQDYQNKVMQSMANQERDWRNYYTQNNLDNANNFKYIEEMNWLNAKNDQFQNVPGRGITYLGNKGATQDNTAFYNELSKLTPQQELGYKKEFEKSKNKYDAFAKAKNKTLV